MDTAPAVLVLGGGPAGTALAARLAAAGVATVVCERSHYDRPRVGEVLVPTIRPLLESLGAWNRFLACRPLASPGVVSVWQSAEPYAHDHLISPYGDAWHIDRLQFDRLLAALAEKAGAVVLSGVRPMTVGRTKRGWRVDVAIGDRNRGRNEERIVSFRVRFLVDATGRPAWLARRLGARRIRIDRLAALVGRIDGGAADPDRRLLLEATDCGWWYAARLPGEVFIATCLVDPTSSANVAGNPQRFWRAELARTVWIRRRLAEAPPPSSVKVVAAESSRLTVLGGADWLALGDAATAWDPLTSQGMYKAIQESEPAAIAIRAALAGDSSLLDHHHEQVAAGFAAHCRQRRKFYTAVDRWPDAPFWLARRASSVRE